MTGIRSLLGGRGKARERSREQVQAATMAARGTLLSLDDLRDGPLRHVTEAGVRSRCQTVTIDQHTALCRVLGRYKVLVDTRDLGLAPHLMLDGFWEAWCTEFMLRRIRPGQVAWDIGANLGYYAVLMADLVGPQGRVLALEPNPRLALLAERTLHLNGFWHTAEVQRLAAADVTGLTLRFRAALSDPKNGRLLASGAPALPPVDGQDEVEIAVRSTRLDDLGEGPVDFVKIDVEGAEEQVWAGMQGLLDRSPGITVLMEFNARRCREAERTLQEIAARFPLRELHLDGEVGGVDIPQILPRHEDTLLVLTRQEP